MDILGEPRVVYHSINISTLVVKVGDNVLFLLAHNLLISFLTKYPRLIFAGQYYIPTSPMIQGTRRPYSDVELKTEAEVIVVVRY